MTRTLSLKRETLAALTDGDLAGIAGGARYSYDQITCPLLNSCLDVSRQITCRGCAGMEG